MNRTVALRRLHARGIAHTRKMEASCSVLPPRPNEKLFAQGGQSPVDGCYRGTPFKPVAAPDTLHQRRVGDVAAAAIQYCPFSPLKLPRQFYLALKLWM